MLKSIVLETEKINAIRLRKATLMCRPVLQRYSNRMPVPPYAPGDILYVRETWSYIYEDLLSEPCGYMYKADTLEDYDMAHPEDNDAHLQWDGKWKPSAIMPKAAARIFLRVTDIQLIRIQDLSNDSIQRMGIWAPDTKRRKMLAKESWDSLLRTKYQKANMCWDKNPLAWAISFEVVEGLERHLCKLEIDKIKDDAEFCEAEYNAAHEYCERCGYWLGEKDLQAINTRGLQDSFDVWRREYIHNLWDEFGDVPMNPETECIEEPWNKFPAGTHREDIWHWFEDTFGISVAEDLIFL